MSQPSVRLQIRRFGKHSEHFQSLREPIYLNQALAGFHQLRVQSPALAVLLKSRKMGKVWGNRLLVCDNATYDVLHTGKQGHF